jgi:hypothetical protein
MNSCGTCTLCCRLLKVPELDKGQNVWCRHCERSVGCRIYEDRPEPCRAFNCLWLQTLSRRPELRPDRCKVVLATTKDGEGVVAHVHPDYPGAWKTGAMGKMLEGLIRRGTKVFIVIGTKRIGYNVTIPTNERGSP